MSEHVTFHVENFNFYYGDFHALHDINVDINKREVTAFIGPSGSGKSTFLKTLNRMQDLVPGARVDGLIELDDKDIYDESYNVNQLRKDVGMVFQQPNHSPRVSMITLLSVLVLTESQTRKSWMKSLRAACAKQLYGTKCMTVWIVKQPVYPVDSSNASVLLEQSPTTLKFF